jgi:uncharacterized protein YqiB (DUF1249 family)
VLRKENTDILCGFLSTSRKRIVIALSHYYRHQSGDMIPDPDMEIAIYPEIEMAEALTYQDTFGFQAVYPSPGKVSRYFLKSHNSFLRQWLINIKAQKHALAPTNEEVAA